MADQDPPADYESLKITSDEPEEYNVQERRKMLYRLVKEKGDPSQLPSNTALGDRFGVSHTQISNDLEIVKEYIRENIGAEAKVRSKIIFDKAIESKVESEDWDGAVDIVSKWNDWLFDVGAQQRHNKDDVNVAVGVDNRTQVNKLVEKLDDGLESAREKVKDESSYKVTEDS